MAVVKPGLPFDAFLLYSPSMFKLAAKKREVYGKDNAVLRAQGLMPIVAYGQKSESASLVVSLGEFKKVLVKAGESTVVTLSTEAGDKSTLIHEVQNDPITGEPIHADFLIIDIHKVVEVGVPLTFVGESPAVKDLGGALVKVLHELEVEALPGDLPHEIEVDISTLVNLDSQITVADLKLPKGVKALAEAEEVVAAITEAGEEIKEEEAPVDLASIEVEKKGKEDEAGAVTEEAK